MRKKSKPSPRRRNRLTPAKVRKVRSLVKKFTDAEVARKIGVLPITVSRVRKREMYASVR